MRSQQRRSVQLTVEQLEGRIVPSNSPHAPPAAATVAPPTAPSSPYALWGSTNWSGIDLDTKNGAVTAVSGSWQVPSVVASKQALYSSTWVGIDGDLSSTVEQVGTESDTAGAGSPQYYAWYEMYPNYAYYATITVNGKTEIAPVSAGDAISASVKYTPTGSGRSEVYDFTLIITDSTQGWTFQTVQALPRNEAPALSSAEWIEEAPSSGGVLPLADFSSVTFTNTMATIGGTTGTIAAFVGNSNVINWGTTSVEEINLIDMGTFNRSGQWTSIEDETSLLSVGANGTDSFTVQYGSSSTGPGGIPMYTSNDRVGLFEAQAESLAYAPAAIVLTTQAANLQRSAATVDQPALTTLAANSSVVAQVPMAAFAQQGAERVWTSFAAADSAGMGNATVNAGQQVIHAGPDGTSPIDMRMAGESAPVGGMTAAAEFVAAAGQPPLLAVDRALDNSAVSLGMLAALLLGWNLPLASGEESVPGERKRRRISQDRPSF